MYANKEFSSINHGIELQETPKSNHLPGYPGSPPPYFPNQPKKSQQGAVGSTSTPDTFEIEQRESTNVSA